MKTLRQEIYEELQLVPLHRFLDDPTVKRFKYEEKALKVNPKFVCVPVKKLEPYGGESYIYHSADTSVELYLIPKEKADLELIKEAINYLEEHKWETMYTCQQAKNDYEYLKKIYRRLSK